MPDLTITEIKPPDSIVIGETFPIDWTVKNQDDNNVAVPDWFDAVYLSRDSIFDPYQDLFLTEFRNIDPLAPGEINNIKESITISELSNNGDFIGNPDQDFFAPLALGGNNSSESTSIAGLPNLDSETQEGFPLDREIRDNLEGDWHLIFITDDFNDLLEADETNNIEAVPIELLAPDLKLSQAQAPATALIHDTIPVSWIVNNIVDVPALTYWYDSIYLSDDDVLDNEDDIELAGFFIDEDTFETESQTPIVPLAGLGQYSLTKNITLHNNISPGSKYLIFSTNDFPGQVETSSTNNTYVLPIEISAVDVDLSITGTSSRSTVSLGESIDIEWTTTNDGSDPANVERIDGVYVSDDPFLSSDDDYITSYSTDAQSLLAPGASIPTPENIIIPNDIRSGDRYLLFVSDYYNSQYETNETNNVYSLPLTIEAPNLKISEVRGLESAVVYGASQPFVSWTVTNESDIDANADYWYDRVYLSTDTTYDDNDSRLHTRYINSSQTPLARESYTTSASVNIPDTAGEYHLLFYTDSTERQGESNELDNVYSVPIEIIASDADLEIDDFDFPSIVNLDGSIEIPLEVTVKNSGTTPITNHYFDRIYLSTDDQLNINQDTLLLNQFKSIEQQPVGAGESYNIDINLNAEDLGVGNYYLIIESDFFNSQKETNEENNTVTIPFEVVDPANLSFIEHDVSSTIVINNTIPISWTIQNTGDEAAYSESWYDSIYISDDQFFDDGDEYLDEFERDNQFPLKSSGTYTPELDLFIPDTAIGNRYLLFVADEFDNQSETDETDNVLAVPIQFLNAPTIIGNISKINHEIAGDLSPEDIYNPSRTGSFSDDYQLTDIPLGELVSLELTSENFDTYLQIIDADTQEVILENNDFGTGTNSQIQFTIAENTNYIVRVTSNSREELGNYTLKSALLPNLIITDATAPELTNIGHTISATWTTKNTGDSDLSNSRNDLIYLSDDQVWDENDELINSQAITRSEPLVVGGEQQVSSKFTIPETTAIGSRYLVFVTDGDETQVETREDDNVFHLPIEIADFQSLPWDEIITSNQKEEGYKFSLREDTLVNFDSLTNAGNVTWSLSGEDGSIVEDRVFWLSDANRIDNSVLKLAAGDYVVVTNSPRDNFITYSFRLSDLAEAETITPNTEISGTVTPGNRTKSYQFDVEAGERFSFDYLSRSGYFYTPNWTLIDPEGEQVFDQIFDADIQGTELSQSGTYTLSIEGQVYEFRSSGNYNFNVIDLGEPQELILGETINATLKKDRYSFTLDEDSLLYFDSLTNNKNSEFQWSLTNASGEVVVDRRLFTESDGNSIDNPVLDLDAGEYTLQIYGNDINNEYSFNLSNLNQAIPLTFDTLINDSFEGGKKTDLYQFTAEAGARFFFDYHKLTGSRSANTYTQWRLIDSQGNKVFDQSFTSDAKDIVVSAAGTYTLLVENSINDFNLSNNISYTFQATKVDAPVNLTLGETVTNTLRTDTYNFSLDEDKQLYVDSFQKSNYTWTLTDELGEIIVDACSFSKTDAKDVDDPVLNLAAGNYSIKIDGSDLLETYSFSVRDLAEEANTLTPGEVLTDSFDTRYGTNIYQFEVEAGERLYVDDIKGSNLNLLLGGGTYWRLIAPNGDSIFADFFRGSNNVGILEFTQSGTYSLLLEDDLNNPNTKEYSFNFRPMTTTPTEISLGETVTGDITSDEYSFSLAEDKSVYFDSLLNSTYTWTLTNDSGEVVETRKFNVDDNNVDDPILDLESGDYLLKITGLNIAGNYNFNIKDIDANAIAINSEDIVTGNFDPSYETDIYQFDGVAGDRLFFDYHSGHNYDVINKRGTYWRLIDPNGNYLFESGFSRDIKDVTLPETGKYTLLLEDDLFNRNVKNYDFSILLQEDNPTALTLGETITSSLEQDRYSFTLNEDSQLYFDSLFNSNKFNWSLSKVDGVSEIIVDQREFDKSDGRYLDNPILNLDTGEYLLEIDGNDTRIDYSFKLSNLNQAEALLLNTPIEGSFEDGKKTDLYQFDAIVGDRFFFDYQSIMGSFWENSQRQSFTQWRLIDPEGNEIFDQPFKTDARDITAAQTGTYTLLIENDISDYAPSATSIDYRFQVGKISPIQDLVLGETVVSNLTTDGYSFTLDEDSLLYFDSLVNNGNFKWSLIKTDSEAQIIVDQRLFTESDANDIDNPVLDLSAGEYLLKIDSNYTTVNYLDYSFRLSDLSQATSLEFGTEIVESFEDGKKTDLYQFDAIVGDRFFFDYLSITGSYWDNFQGQSFTRWRLIDPEGNQIFDQPFKNDAKDITVEQTGTYTLLVENDIADYNQSATSIDYRFQVDKIAPVQELILGETVTNTLSTDSYSFSLEEDSLLYFDSLLNNSKFKWSLTKTDEIEEVVIDQRLFTKSDGNDITVNPVLDLAEGDYLLKIDGNDSTIDYSFRLSDLSQATSLEFGTEIVESFEDGKKTDLYQFDAIVGDHS